MREIKFRVWDVQNSSMLSFEYLQKVKIFALAAELPSSEFLVMPYSDKYIPQQFTGLLDHHKKDIYEGDILESCTDKMLLKWVVVFEDGCFGIKNTGGLGYEASPFHSAKGIYYFSDRTIIGNIYENPELKS